MGSTQERRESAPIDNVSNVLADIALDAIALAREGNASKGADLFALAITIYALADKSPESPNTYPLIHNVPNELWDIVKKHLLDETKMPTKIPPSVDGQHVITDTYQAAKVSEVFIHTHEIIDIATGESTVERKLVRGTLLPRIDVFMTPKASVTSQAGH